jgi:diaminohydroxyphosphoribosylaminopyrimidine deaminase/5-amino-6-(5-phosphoribosylamino)uracil reductase
VQVFTFHQFAAVNTNGHKDILFMQRALELSENGRGNVSPNPMVGCVIVHDEVIIGEGWTQPYGGAHAEVHAVGNVVDKGLLADSTAYVTLEPCAHFGKTPPCADLLIAHQLRRVVVACTDPNPLVAGKGIAKLTAASIAVDTGVLEQEAISMNRRFFSSINKNRPYIILKWAETKDGFIARSNFDSKWISNEYSRKLVHQWRAEEDAIMVGTNTAKHDNPTLNVRDWQGNDPIRIVIDKQLALDHTLNLFTGHQPTICYNLKANKVVGNTTFVQVEEENFLEVLMRDLHNRKIQSLIVEGGAMLLQSFIQHNLWDEARIFIGDVTFGSGIAKPTVQGTKVSEQDIHGDQLITIRKNEKK